MKRCPKCNRKFENNESVCPFDNIPLAETAEDPLIGTTLDKRYKVTEKIGEGGMGKVYKAEHTILGKPFALKILNPELAKREDSLKRFVNEAKLTSKLGHPNIVEVTDFGKTPTGSFYFVMEYVKGKTLFDLLCKSKTIPADKTADILTQCADALYAAHNEGIIHRDLKPDNIMLADKGNGSYFVKILDFGISKIAGDINPRLTSSGVIIGTPEYMSPEQASQENVDHRTDIYSLGVIMYQMLTGNLPFVSSNPLNLLMMHKTKSPKPLKSYNPSVSPLFESICLKCLAKNPSDRFQNMKEFINAIQDALKGKAVSPASKSGIDFLKDITPIQPDVPPAEIPPEKIDEVRKELFADSNSVWFDPYSKPQVSESVKPAEINEKPSSIIIDVSAAEKSIDPEPVRKKTAKPESEELLLVTEVPKPKSPVPKVHIPLKEKTSAIKEEQTLNLEKYLNKQNLLIGFSILLTIGFIIGIIIYKSVISGIDSELKKEITFNTPSPVNPVAVKQEPAKSDNENKEEQNQTDRKTDANAQDRKAKAQASKPEKSQSARQDKPESAKDYFTEANNYFKQGKYDIAAEYYKSAIRLKPDFAMAYRGLGACYAMLGKADLSIKQYEKYIELDPNGPDVDKVINIINEYRNRKK